MARGIERVLILAGGLAATSTGVAAARLVDPSVRPLLGSWFGLLPEQAPSGDGRAVLVLVVALSVLALVVVWAFTVHAAVLGRLRTRAVAVMWAVWATPFVLCPPLFSRDIFSYAAQGQLLRAGFDPYQVGPSAMPRTALLHAVDPRWRDAKAPYGPVGLWLERTAAGVVPDSGRTTVVVLRVFAVVAVVLVAVLAVRLAAPRPAATVLALFALNPIVLLHLMSGGHLESVMVALLLAGLALRRAGHVTAGIALVTAAGLVKAPALLALGCLVVLELYQADGLRARLRVLARDVAVVAAIWVGSALLVQNPHGWVSALRTPGAARTLMTPAVASASAAHQVLGWIGIEVSEARLLPLSVALYGALAVVLVVRLLLTALRRDLLRTVGFTLLCAALLGPVTHPWYLIWGLTCLIPAAAGGAVRTRALLLVLCGLAALTELPSARGATPDIVITATGVLVALVALATTAWVGWATMKVPWRPLDRETRPPDELAVTG